MKPIKIKIKDGINLNFIPENRFKTNYLSVDFLCKISKETAALNTLLVRVLKRGTESYPDMAKLNEALDMLYASSIYAKSFKIGDVQSFGFSSFPLDNAYGQGCDILFGVIDILHEIIFHPYTENGLLCEKYVESEKRNLCDQIRAQKDNKDAFAVQRCKEIMTSGDIYAIPSTGTVEDVEKISARSLTEYYKTAIENTTVEIYFIGKCDIDKLTQKFREFFADVKIKPGVDKIKSEPMSKHSDVREVCDKLPVNQGKLCMGFYTGYTLYKPGYEKFSLFCEIFGGSPVAKLFMNVREKLSLCYYCQAIPESHKGIMFVASGIENKNKETAKEEILLQLEKCKNGEISEDELSAAKKSLINAYSELNDDTEALKSWYLSRSIAGRDDSPEEAAEAVSRLTSLDVAEAAKDVSLDTVYFLCGTGGDDAEEIAADGGNDND